MKTIVVGAGGAGIASALLSSLRGEEVILLEAHSYLGGCASHFKRGAFTFDVGATTLSGVSHEGPLGELFSLLSKRPALRKVDPGIVFHLSSGKIIHYFSNFEKWMDELEKHFPHLNHRPFWKKVTLTAREGWRFLKEVKSFPVESFLDLVRIVKRPKTFSLLPDLLLSTDILLKHYNLHDKDYLELINGILIISAQTTAEDTPFLVGAMGLTYPADTYAPIGGMRGLMQYFEEELNHLNVTIKTKTKVTSITETSVSTVKGESYSGDRLILNIPVWNIASLIQDDSKKKLMRAAISNPGFWGAFTVYFGSPTKIQELYQQVHLNHKKVKNYFVSFSVPGEISSAPEGFQAVTISTHVDASLWFGLEKSEYEERKKEMEEIIVTDFKNRFNVSDLKFVTSGTPKTFERFTGRKSGFVGGLPLVYGKNPFSLMGTTIKNKTFRVGDTVFPGQGLCGVAAGALQLHKRLAK